MTDTFTDADLGVDLESLLGETDPDEVAHIVRRVGGIGGGELVLIAIQNRMELQALCGRRWIPVALDPDLPPCKKCVEEWQRLTGGGS